VDGFRCTLNVNFLCCFSGSLQAGHKVSKCFSANWSNKMAPKHIMGYWPFLITKTSESLIFLMHIQRLNFTQCLFTGFGQLLRILWTFLSFVAKNAPKTRIAFNRPFRHEKYLRYWSFLKWKKMTWNSIPKINKYTTILDRWCS
jgi:hypothetical protein